MRLTPYANRLPHTPVLQDHRFIRKSDRTVKSASYFTDGNKIKRTLRGINDRMERKGRERMSQPIPLAIVWEPLAKVTVGKVEVVVIEEKRCLLPEI